MLDLDCFIAECRAAVSLDPTHKSVREIVARAVSEPAAVIAEDNIFWRRLPGQDGARIEAAGAKSLGERDVEALGRDIIHTVINPLPRLTGAIHVYAGILLLPLSQRMGSGNAARTTVRHGEKPAIVRTGERPSRLELTGLRCRVLDTVRT
jgi:hypothetical protein